MKLKFPKTIQIGDHKFKVKTDSERGDGYFSYTDGVLFIGTKKLRTQPSRVLGIIIHELKEMIQVEQATRYIREDDDTCYEFHYTHKDHAELCSRLAGLLTEFIK